MANNCCTNVAIYSDGTRESEAELRELASILEQINSNPRNTWEGHVLEALGINPENVRCRGNICDVDVNADYILIYCDDAWSPQTEVWDAVTDHFDTLAYVYTAEEPGCGIFINTDCSGDYFIERYRTYYEFDNHSEEEKPYTTEYDEYWESEKAMLSTWSARIGKKFHSMAEIENFFYENSREDEYFSVNAFEAN